MHDASETRREEKSINHEFETRREEYKSKQRPNSCYKNK